MNSKIVSNEGIEVIIGQQNLGAIFSVTCEHGGEFEVQVIDPVKSIVNIKSLGGGLWGKYNLMGKLTKLTKCVKLPAPEATVTAPLVDTFYQKV